jgi:hypothetical protein
MPAFTSLTIIKVIKSFFFLMFIVCFQQANAQMLQWSIGSGATLFKGDMQEWALYPNKAQIKELIPSLNVELAYQGKSALAYRGQILITGLQGNSQNNIFSNSNIGVGTTSGGMLIPNEGAFRASLVEVAFLVDYNFLDYQKNRKIINWTPYLFGGFASFFANPQNSIKDPNTAVPPNTQHPNVMNGSFISFAVPFGIGVKYQINNMWSLKLEAGNRKTLTDRLDGWISNGASRSNMTTNFTDQYMNVSFSVTISLPRIFCPSEYQN